MHDRILEVGLGCGQIFVVVVYIAHLIDWTSLRAEYISTNIGQRKLAEKYNVPLGSLIRRANIEGWASLRQEAYNKALIKSEQLIADAIKDNIEIAQRIKTKLLLKLEKEIDELPDIMGSETRQAKSIRNLNAAGAGIVDDKALIYKIRDLTSAYRDLTEEYNKASASDIEDLSALAEMLKE